MVTYVKFCCIKKVCSAVKKEAVATPESNKVAVDFPAAWDMNTAIPTAKIAPEKAPTETVPIIFGCADPKKTIAKVAPKPAPDAAPSKKGSAKGLLKTPW